MKKDTLEFLHRYQDVLLNFKENNKNTIPFCAAEPIVSEVIKSALNSPLADRYIKCGITNFNPLNEFIGSEFIYPLYELVSNVCKNLFGAYYADARPLSGMNAAITVLMSLTEPGEKVLLLSPDAGGHDSFPEICRRLSLSVDMLPFDYDSIMYNVSEINHLLDKNNYSAVIIPPSDLIAAPPIHQINTKKDTYIIYDCTQSFGLIASKHHNNPLSLDKKIILLGGTHKTISGPTSGLVLCNNKETITRIEKKISPTYIRNPHPHHIAALFLSLVEFIEYGSEFMQKTIANANFLAAMLEERGFNVKKLNDNSSWKYTETHQIFLSLTIDESNRIDKQARRLNISLNKKNIRIYGNSGIRLGTQAITRLGWDNNMLSDFSDLLLKMKDNTPFNESVKTAELLRGKNEILFSFDSNEHGFPIL